MYNVIAAYTQHDLADGAVVPITYGGGGHNKGRPK